MNTFFANFKKTTITPYLIVIVLTLIIAWFLFKDKSASTEVIDTNDIAITKIQAIGKIELVKLTIKDVLEHQVKRNYLPDSKVLLVVSGEMAGCIDLTKINISNVNITDSVLKITLPNPEICYYKIDHQKTKIYNATTYYMLDNDADLIQTMYKKAELYFTSDSLTAIVFRETELNAQKILKPLLENLTNKHVELTFAKKPIKN